MGCCCPSKLHVEQESVTKNLVLHSQSSEKLKSAQHNLVHPIFTYFDGIFPICVLNIIITYIITLASVIGKDKPKILMLGAGGGGKTSIFTASEILSNLDMDLIRFSRGACNNAIEAIQELIRQSAKLGPIQTDEGKNAADFIMQFDLDVNSVLIDSTLATHVENVWKDPGIQKTYQYRSNFQLFESASYWLKNIQQLTDPSYCLTNIDMLQTHIRTTGIVDSDVQIPPGSGLHFALYDVGGQRNERKKWKFAYEDTELIMFFVSLSEYDLAMLEDTSKNRMQESLELFCHVTKLLESRHEEIPILLVFNKLDIFSEKIKTVPLTICFPDFNGPVEDLESASKFIEKEFLKQNKTNNVIYTYTMCAIDLASVNDLWSIITSVLYQHKTRTNIKKIRTLSIHTG